jgi:MtrB/PioB family decaheme-associated outer membrane protein
MSKMQRTVGQAARLTALSAALVNAGGMALAQDAEVAELVTPESSVSIGAGYWTKDRPRLGIYDGMNKEGGYGLLDASIVNRDNASGTWLTLDARNIGLETREFRVDWLRQGDIGAFLEYSRIPRDNPYTFLTGVQGIGTATLRVPTPSATTLNEVHLGTVRDRTGVGFFKSLGGGLGFRVHLQNEDKTGTRQWGRGGAPEFAVEPIESNTRQLEAILSYAGKAFQIQGGYYGSWYTNDIKIVDTALTTVAAASRFFLSQPLSNQAHQFFVNGGYNFTPGTRATFKVAYTQATQDETIPVGAGVATFAGAPTNLDGRIDTTLLQLGLTSRLSDSFSWLASLRNYESDEKTQQRRIVQTNPACLTPSQCVDNTPLTFETLTGKLEGTYRMMRGLSLLGGIEQTNQDRKIPFGNLNASGVDNQRWVPWRAEVDETTYRLQLRRSLSETLNGSLAYLHGKRDGSAFTLTNEPPHTDFINPIHIADRDRDKVRLMLDWAPTEVLSFTFNVEHSQDEYGYTAARPYGLRDGEATLFSLDAAYAVTDRWQVSAFYSRDQTEATQFGFRHASPVEAEKQAHLEDVGDTVGLGLRGVLVPRVKAGGEFLYSKNVNRYPETIVPTAAGALYPAGAAGPLPDITNKLVRLKLFATYALKKNAEVRLDYIHERWRTDDWSWFFADNTTPFTYGATTDGTQVIDPRRQTADFIGVRYIYRFF